MKIFPARRPLAAWLACLAALPACMTLDGLLFRPVTAPPGQDLLAAAVAIPAHLREEHDLPSDDGGFVNSYLVTHRLDDGTPEINHRTGILLCQGSSGHIGFSAGWVEMLWSRGFTVLVFDYRGYGKSPGAPSEAGLYADARLARRYLESRVDLIDPPDIALYGFSLGAAVALQLAVDAPVGALLLEAPFASLAAVLGDNQPLDEPIAWYTDARFDNAAKVAQHAGRLFVASAGHDIVTPPAQADSLVALARAAGREVETFVRADAGHTEIRQASVEAWTLRDDGPPLTIDPDYLGRVERFIQGAGGRAARRR